MATKIPYKSFCWSLGTTSFRTKNFNKTIEEQLGLLNEFWLCPDVQNEAWTGNNVLQSKCAIPVKIDTKKLQKTK